MFLDLLRDEPDSNNAMRTRLGENAVIILSTVMVCIQPVPVLLFLLGRQIALTAAVGTILTNALLLFVLTAFTGQFKAMGCYKAARVLGVVAMIGWTVICAIILTGGRA